MGSFMLNYCISGFFRVQIFSRSAGVPTFSCDVKFAVGKSGIKSNEINMCELQYSDRIHLTYIPVFHASLCIIVCAINSAAYTTLLRERMKLKTFSRVDKFAVLFKTFSRYVKFALASRFAKLAKIKPPRKKPLIQ